MTAQELREWRELHKFSVTLLANALRVTKKTIYRWEEGQVPLPADIVQRLMLALAERAKSEEMASEPENNEIDPDKFVMDSEQEHGTVLGCYKDWYARPESERIAWIMAADDPMLAMGWPFWSFGWSYWPPRGKKQPTRQNHYINKQYLGGLRKRMEQESGEPKERLRKAVIFFMLNDKHMAGYRGKGSDDDYAMLKAMCD